MIDSMRGMLQVAGVGATLSRLTIAPGVSKELRSGKVG